MTPEQAPDAPCISRFRLRRLGVSSPRPRGRRHAAGQSSKSVCCADNGSARLCFDGAVTFGAASMIAARPEGRRSVIQSFLRTPSWWLSRSPRPGQRRRPRIGQRSPSCAGRWSSCGQPGLEPRAASRHQDRVPRDHEDPPDGAARGARHGGGTGRGVSPADYRRLLPVLTWCEGARDGRSMDPLVLRRHFGPPGINGSISGAVLDGAGRCAIERHGAP